MTYKYDALYLYLKGHSQAPTTLSFRAIERIIGRPLPPEAETSAEWWTNEYSNGVQALAWLQAGYMAFPDFTTRTVRFDRREYAHREGQKRPLSV